MYILKESHTRQSYNVKLVQIVYIFFCAPAKRIDIFLISDPEMKYINLTPQHTDKYYEAESGGYVQWVVYVDGYPKPHLQW